MEEKERYEWNSPYDSVVRDNKNDDIINAIERLNEQDKRIKELEQEKQQLKQQLHDLPNKIVEDIKKELYDCGRTYLEDEPYIEICIVKGILDTILKKYGGEDESNND